MNTIRSYKALAIVSNVDQGEMIKRLIKENKESQRLKKITEKCIPGLVEIYRFLKEQHYHDIPTDENGIYDINFDDGSGEHRDGIQIHNLLLPLSDYLDEIYCSQLFRAHIRTENNLVIVTAVPTISS